MKTIPRSVPHHPVPAKWAWHYRTLIALRRHLLARTAERLAEPVDAMEPPSLHCEDLVDEVYDRDLAAILPASPGLALQEIDGALHRITAGTYGKCEKTGRPIPKALLRAIPWQRSTDVETTTR